MFDNIFWDFVREVIRSPYTLFQFVRNGFRRRPKCAMHGHVMLNGMITTLHCDKRKGHLGKCRAWMDVSVETLEEEEDEQ